MPQRQVGFFGNFQPTGVDQTVGSDLRALAGLSGQVSDIAFQKKAQQREKEGRIAGQQSVQRDEQGNIQTPQMEDEGGIFGRSFNKAAILTHKAEASRDARETLDRLQNEHKLDAQAFKVKGADFKKGILKGMSPEMAAIIGNDIDNAISDRHSAILKNTFRHESEKQRATALEAVETMQDDILNGVRAGEDVNSKLIDSNAELDAWVDAQVISPQEAVKIKEDTQERIQEQKTLKGIEDVVFNEELSLEEQFKKGTDFVKRLREESLPDLSPEQKDSLTRVVEAKVDGIGRQIQATQNQRDIATEKLVSNLKIQANLVEERAKNGEPVDLSDLTEQVEFLHNKGKISGNERTSLLTHMEKAGDEIDRIKLAEKRIIARLQGDNTIEMNQKDIDFHYKKNNQDIISQLPPKLQSAANAEFITKTRTVPSQVKSQLTSQILSGDPDQILQAGDLVDRVDNIPGMPSIVTPNQRAFMDVVTQLSQTLAPEQAVQEARKLTDPTNKARVEAREQEIKDEEYRKKYEGVVENAFESFLGSDFLRKNINKEQVESEYKSLFESYFKNGMSKDNAQAKAIEVLQNNWKESQFGFMKAPPEDYYSVAGETDYMKKQLIRDISKSSIGLKFDNDDVFLLSDETTVRKAAQGNPDYKVMVIDSNGQFVAIDGRWSPDKQEEVKRQQELNLGSLKERRGMKEAVTELEGVF